MSATPEPSEVDSILTIDEAARSLAIPKATLYTSRTRRVGLGPRALKVGGCLRYCRSDLDAWIVDHLETFNECDHNDSRRGKASNPNRGVSLTRRRSTT